MNKGRIFIISGPSGVGKGTVLSEVLKKTDGCWFSISATTRKPRPHEVDGVHYHFIDRNKFLDMIQNGEFLEYAEYVDNFYGTPAGPIAEHIAAGTDVFLDVETQGSRQLCQKIPEAVSIFIVPPSIEALGERLRGRRTESESKIAERLRKAQEELNLASTYDYTVVNDNIEDAAAEIIRIIAAERKKIQQEEK